MFKANLASPRPVCCLSRMSYEALATRHRRLAHLGHCESILAWDEAAMMPVGGGESRAEAIATLRVLVHELATDPGLGALFEAAEQERAAGKLEPWQAANLREMKRVWVRETCLPADLVEASSRAESRCEQTWRILRAKNDWAGLLPLLREVVARKREVAAALSSRLGLDPYDALLDGYEPGARSAAIDVLFADLRAFLPGLIQTIQSRQAGERVLIPEGPFPTDRQRWLGIEVMKVVGFDFEHGRLDASHHPFCGGVPRDVRITTRYDERDFIKSFMGVLHETGHAKYEQNLPASWLDQPVGRARSMSVHESQSLFQEMQVSRSRPFLELCAPLVRAAFPDAAARQPEAFTAENLAAVYTRVHPDYIRVDADEATYPCHVILRYELEKELILGKMAIDDLPEAWDAGMQSLLGLSTKDNYKDGCLQDVHWPAGLFGYFPTYTMGAMTAAQLFAAARRALPDLSGQIARGELTPLNDWLRERVWSRGSMLETNALLTEATGSPLTALPFKHHLESRYLAQS
jgi:carboxypeptidase Taq